MDKKERDLFFRVSSTVDPAMRKREARKKNLQKISGIFMFELFLVLSFLNFLLGGFFFVIIHDTGIKAVYFVVALCFINTLALFIMAIESYYVHVANKKDEWISLQYGGDDL